MLTVVQPELSRLTAIREDGLNVYLNGPDGNTVLAGDDAEELRQHAWRMVKGAAVGASLVGSQEGFVVPEGLPAGWSFGDFAQSVWDGYGLDGNKPGLRSYVGLEAALEHARAWDEEFQRRKEASTALVSSAQISEQLGVSVRRAQQLISEHHAAKKVGRDWFLPAYAVGDLRERPGRGWPKGKSRKAE